VNLHRNKRTVGSLKHLIGVGLDCDDGHNRITTSEDFSVFGGSDETHSKLSETFIKTSEQLSAKRKSIIEVTTEELAELLDKNTPH
jgi:uncharacterized protein YjlB